MKASKVEAANRNFHAAAPPSAGGSSSSSFSGSESSDDGIEFDLEGENIGRSEALMPIFALDRRRKGSGRVIWGGLFFDLEGILEAREIGKQSGYMREGRARIYKHQPHGYMRCLQE